MPRDAVKWEGNYFRSGYKAKKRFRDKLFDFLIILMLYMLLFFGGILAYDIYLYLK